jgi:hypothetical protein
MSSNAEDRKLMDKLLTTYRQHTKPQAPETLVFSDPVLLAGPSQKPTQAAKEYSEGFTAARAYVERHFPALDKK